MVRLLQRSAIALAVLVAGLVLQALGIGVGIAVAAVGLIALFVVNLIAPWPWQQDWRE
jgi:hypothetical protein